jgi:hypothetical protein
LGAYEPFNLWKAVTVFLSDVLKSREVGGEDNLLMRVFITPGAYALTVMSYFPKSEAFKENLSSINKSTNIMNHGEKKPPPAGNGVPAAWVKPRIANLDAQYAEAMPAPAPQ